METIQGLNELIKNRLIEKKGNIKLSENLDIILYGKALGISENQLLFKILEIEETIDWTKEKENINIPETFTTVDNVSNPNNILYCSNCNAANEKDIANFCVDCGTDLRQPEPNLSQPQYYPPSKEEGKYKLLFVIGGSILILVVILLVLFFVSEKTTSTVPNTVLKKISDTTQVQETNLINSTISNDSASQVNQECPDCPTSDTFNEFQKDTLTTANVNNKNQNTENYGDNYVSQEDNTIYSSAGIEVKPDFPGGIAKFYSFIQKNYVAPDEPGLKGQVFVSFVIEKDGSLTDIKVLRDIGYGTGKEAERVLRKCPRWIPAEQYGKKVRCLYQIPIKIETPEE